MLIVDLCEIIHKSENKWPKILIYKESEKKQQRVRRMGVKNKKKNVYSIAVI